jgi:tetratricopeptide (TPR) repeat protein
LDDFEGCIADCSKAIELDGTYPYAYLNRGNAKELLRNDEGACEDWNKAIELGAKGVETHLSGCK